VKRLALVALLVNSGFAADTTDFIEKCGIEYELMYSIATQERHKHKPVGYPYLISLNKKEDQALARDRNVTENWLDRRTIDCQNSKNCQELYKTLYSIGIKNVDLGAYQINPVWHKHPTEQYFNTEKSYLIACDYLKSLYAEQGEWNWKTIASYHSHDTNRNLAYQAGLKKIYKGYIEHE